jgi:hypothetical protein
LGGTWHNSFFSFISVKPFVNSLKKEASRNTFFKISKIIGPSGGIWTLQLSPLSLTLRSSLPKISKISKIFENFENGLNCKLSSCHQTRFAAVEIDSYSRGVCLSSVTPEFENVVAFGAETKQSVS